MVLWQHRGPDNRVVVCGGRETSGQYAGMFNVAAGKHDAGERRIDTLMREFYEEIGMHMDGPEGYRLSEAEVINAAKAQVGGTIVALVRLGKPLSRKAWNERAQQFMRRGTGAGVGEMDELQLFDAESFPCGGAHPKTHHCMAKTLPSRAGRGGELVAVSPFFVACMNAFKRMGLLPAKRCEFFLQGECTFGDKCFNLHDWEQSTVCRFFRQGECKFGDECKFLHIAGM